MLTWIMPLLSYRVMEMLAWLLLAYKVIADPASKRVALWFEAPDENR